MFVILEKLGELASKANGAEVFVKFINRTTASAYLEMINSEGDRELKTYIHSGADKVTLSLQMKKRIG